MRDADDVIDLRQLRRDPVHQPAPGARGAPAGRQLAVAGEVGDHVMHGDDGAAVTDERQVDGIAGVDDVNDVGPLAGELQRRDDEAVEVVGELARQPWIRSGKSRPSSEAGRNSTTSCPLCSAASSTISP